MPLQATSGAASYDAFGGGVPVVPNYIEDVFSTYLYTGNGSTQTITNGIDLSTKGGLVWFKNRVSTNFHNWVDTARGNTSYIYSNDTSGEDVITTRLTSFNTTGFSLDSNTSVNGSGSNYVSWTFRKQPKFFDVVTYTGDGTARQISHALGSVPGCIIVKRTDVAANWQVWHTSVEAAGFGAMNLNTTGAAPSGNYVFRGASFQTSTEFGVTGNATTNASGGTYVAYLFASSNAGGFGLTGTDNVISCGSYTGNGSATGPIVTLGYEPQWLMVKNTTGTGNWQMIDNMRGMPVGSADATLQANAGNAETSVDYASPTPTGFQIASTSSDVNTTSSTYIYIAIRRGPMKVPTSGTSVYNGIARTGTGTNNLVVNTTVLPNSLLTAFRIGSSKALFDRLRGFNRALETSSTVAEYNNPGYGPQAMGNTSYTQGSSDGSSYNLNGYTFIDWVFSRAPSFFDEVCYTGTGSLQTQTHNLQAVPELMIFKQRSSANPWIVYNSTSGPTKYMNLNTTGADVTGAQPFNNTAPTSTVFTVNTSGGINASGQTYVAYLFATCAGVSKVGSYTGTGATQTINCGFGASGSRFVLIKRTDSTGDWYVWDSARGMVAGTDPYLQLNNTSGETNTNSVYTTTGGFQIVSTAADINASGGSYIFFAVA